MYEVCAHAQAPTEWVLCVLEHNLLFLMNTHALFVMHMVYDI